MSQTLEVWLDSDLGPMARIGSLSHDRGQIRFAYDKGWIHDPRAFAVDPDLSLGGQAFFPNPELGNFGIFLDSSPDRWGQTLMKRREALQAKDEQRVPRNLYAWDYLIGVQDFTRQGALRFRKEGEETFLGAEKLAAPPVTSLRELQVVATQLTSKKLNDLDALRQWLAVLVAPGASLGGARPKANFTEQDGSLWIGKFPAKDDDRDIAAWEYLAYLLAQNAGIVVPEARLLSLGKDFRTLGVKRFDRSGAQRRFYASAMTLLRKEHSEGTSYLEIAQFLRSQGDGAHVGGDLEQLYRRVAFNVAIGNRDDHLRNHGFILAKNGWRLSPAFDMNPNIDKADHVLNIDDTDNRPKLQTVIATATFYGLNAPRARAIVDEVMQAVRPWREMAASLKLARADILLMEAAFQAIDAV